MRISESKLRSIIAEVISEMAPGMMGMGSKIEDMARACCDMSREGLFDMCAKICAQNSAMSSACAELCVCACRGDHEGCCRCLGDICKCDYCAQICATCCGC